MGAQQAKPARSNKPARARSRAIKTHPTALLGLFFFPHRETMQQSDADDREMDTLGGGPTMAPHDQGDDDDPFVVPRMAPHAWSRGTRADMCASGGVWALYLGIALFVPLAAATVVFLPWFFIGLWPDIALEHSLHATTCNVLNHTVIDTKPVDGNMRLLYMPGVRVCVAAWSRTALATSHIKASDSWMSREVMDDYRARRPPGATVTCYADDRDGVAMYPDVVGIKLAPCVAITCVVFALVLFVTLTCIVGDHIQRTSALAM